MQTVRILLLDDHTLFRESLSRLLAAEPDFHIVASCGSISEALLRLSNARVDLVLLDFDLGQERAFEFLAGSRHAGYIGRILMVTAGMSDRQSAQLLSQGVDGIFLKHDAPSILLDAIRKVMTGETWLDRRSVQALASAARQTEGTEGGRYLTERAPAHLGMSLLAAAWRLGLPATVHVAVGTDIVHMHPACDPAALGRATHLDFRLLAAEVARLGGGGVYLNVGSAVMLPEVFLKAVTLARNLGHALNDFTTANLDFIQSYRPNTNVVERPTRGVGRGYSLTGHHEILVPLLAAALIEG